MQVDALNGCCFSNNYKRVSFFKNEFAVA